jgi:hypothetical protein
MATTLAALLVHGATAQYCSVGRTAPGCPAALSITSVAFSDLFEGFETSVSGCEPSGYEAPWGPGVSYFGSAHGLPVTVTVGVVGLQPTDGVTLWLDYDQSGSFDANEAFDASIVPAPLGTWKAVCTLTTPACSLQTGIARLRVAAVRGQPSPQPACGFYADGDWEDYDYSMAYVAGFFPSCPKVVGLGANFVPMTSLTGSWISFTPATTGGYALKTFDAGNFISAVYESVGGALVSYSDPSGSGGNLALSLIGGRTYVVQYQNYFNPGSISVTVSSLPSVPANDQCAGATPVGLGATPNNALGSATAGPGAQAPCPVYRDLWFSFTAPAAGAYSFAATIAYSAPPMAVNVYSSCGGVPLACGAGSATAQLAAGQSCALRIGDPVQQGPPSGLASFDLHIAATAGPSTTLSVAPGSLSIGVAGGVPGSAYFFAVTLNQGTFPNGPFFGIDPDWNDVWLQFNAGPPFRGNLDANGAAAHGPYVGLPPGLTFFAVTVTNLFGPIPAATTPVSATTI